MPVEDDIALIEQHYGEESLARWKAFYCAAEAAATAGEGPAGEAGLALVEQWASLSEKLLGDPETHTAVIRAYYQREQWPPGLQERIAQFVAVLRAYHTDERISGFLAKAFEAHRSRFFDDETWKNFFGGPLAPGRQVRLVPKRPPAGSDSV